MVKKVSLKVKRFIRNYRLNTIDRTRPLIAVILLIGMSGYGLAQFKSAAATTPPPPTATLSLTPTSQTVAVGGTVTFNMAVDVANGSGYGVQGNLDFDPAMFDSGTVACASGWGQAQNTVDTVNGIIQVACFNSTIGSPIVNGTFATVTLHAAAGGVDDIAYRVNGDTESQVNDSTNKNILSSTTGGTYTVDATPPQTTIDSSPSNPSNDQNPSFSFSSNEAGSTFQCQLDGGGYSPCSSPKTYSGLSNAAHTFSVKSTDPYGNTDPSPSTSTWTISNNVPTVSITAPSNNTKYNASSSPVTITANASSAGGVSDVTFKVDGVNLGTPDSNSPYASSITWDPTTAADGNHVISAVATDAVSNNTSTAQVTVNVDNTVPNTTINSGPSGTVQTQAATFTFSSNDNTATFQCSLDGGSYSACTSPKNYSGLALSSHTFSVRARDANGNIDATPATQTWTVADTTAPTNPGTPSTTTPTYNTTPTWNWSSSTDAFGINHYEVQWCTDNTFTGCNSNTATSNTTNYTHASALNVGTWYFRVRAVDNNTNPSAWVSGSVVIQLQPLTISSFNVAPTDTSATVTWTTNLVSSTQIKYSVGLASETFDVTGAKTDTSSGVTSHTATISSLIPCVTYHVQGLSDDSQSRSDQSADTQFATSGCPGGATVSGAQSADTSHAAGGSVNFNDGDGQTVLTIPANASTVDLTYQIMRLSTQALGVVAAPDNLKPVASRVYQFKALSDPSTEATTFDQPLTVVMHYTDDQAKLIKAETMRIYSRESGNWNQLDGCSVDTSAKTVSCTTTHFSSFALYGEETSAVQQIVNDILPKTGASALRLAAFCGLIAVVTVLFFCRRTA